jgi:hypothetical protein
MMPRLSIFLIVVIVAAYLAGAKWPMLAQKIGVA